MNNFPCFIFMMQKFIIPLFFSVLFLTTAHARNHLKPELAPSPSPSPSSVSDSILSDIKSTLPNSKTASPQATPTSPQATPTLPNSNSNSLHPKPTPISNSNPTSPQATPTLPNSNSNSLHPKSTPPNSNSKPSHTKPTHTKPTRSPNSNATSSHAKPTPISDSTSASHQKPVTPPNSNSTTSPHAKPNFPPKSKPTPPPKSIPTPKQVPSTKNATSSPYQFSNNFCLSRRLDVKKTFCLQVLRSSPTSTEANDNLSLLTIVANSAIEFSNKNIALLKKLLTKKKTKPDLKTTITDCVSAYEGYVKQFETLVKESKIEAQLAGYDSELATLEINRCVKALGETDNAEIEVENKDALDYARLAQNIADAIEN